MVQPSARRLRNKPEVPEMNPFRMLSAAQNTPIIRSVLRKVSGITRFILLSRFRLIPDDIVIHLIPLYGMRLRAEKEEYQPSFEIRVETAPGK